MFLYPPATAVFCSDGRAAGGRPGSTGTSDGSHSGVRAADHSHDDHGAATALCR
ncbi:unnamed protein product, partial [Closterium sp. NIES-64]